MPWAAIQLPTQVLWISPASRCWTRRQPRQRAELKRLRAAHAAEVRQLKADARAERIALEERVTALQVEITRLERDANVTTARTTLEAARATLEAEERQRVAAQAEAARLRDHGRAWQQARELQAQLECVRAEALETAEQPSLPLWLKIRC